MVFTSVIRILILFLKEMGSSVVKRIVKRSNNASNPGTVKKVSLKNSQEKIISSTN